MPRGTLRIYLGAAPGVGKTYAMLGEAHRRRSRGADVVVGLAETHGRAVARVRCVVDKLRHSAWKELADLRLHDPANPPRREVAPPARRPAGAVPVTAPDEDDATRPHVLLAGMRTRPSKPAHATTPPRPRVPAPPMDRPRVPTALERRRAYLTTA